MTARQQQIFDYLVSFFDEHGYAPTLGEICKGCYTTSRGYIRETLWRFEKMGLIEIEDGKHRAIRIK